MQASYIQLRHIFPRDIAGEIIRWRGKLDMKEYCADEMPRSYREFGIFKRTQNDEKRPIEAIFRACMVELEWNIRFTNGKDLWKLPFTRRKNSNDK